MRPASSPMRPRQGFDPALTVRGPAPLPLLWFGLYRRRRCGSSCRPAGRTPWATGSPARGSTAIARPSPRSRRPSPAATPTRSTTPSRCARPGAAIRGGCSWTWPGPARRLRGLPRPGALRVICSASPELFLAIDGDRVVSKPMKGTAPRGRTLAEDRQNVAASARLPKGPGRERDDRGHDPQRPGAHRPLRQRAACLACWTWSAIPPSCR
jgi:para-aminobenzoate synthetase / 4-amino-4-deoxychorismate lyase